MTRICSSCDAPLADGARFCRSCGAAADVPDAEPTLVLPSDGFRCDSCGTELATNARFCRVCGAERHEATAVMAQPQGAPAPPPGPLPSSPVGPPVPGRSRTGFVALIAVLVLVFGAIGGTAAYLLVLKDDDSEPVSSTPAGDRAFGTADVRDEETDADPQPPPDSNDDAFPDVPETEMEEEIATLLTDFHESIVAGQPEDAWEQLSTRKQRQIEREDGFAAWSKAQSSLEPHLDPSGLTVSIDALDPDEGTARVLVTGMRWSKPGAGCSEWSGLTWVKYENGSWRYDPGYSTTAARERAWEPRFEELLGGSC